MQLESEQQQPSAEFLAELVETSARLEDADPLEIIEWTVNRFPGRVALAASFQDAALVDMAVRVDPSIEVIFLDTEFHFPETLAYVERLRRRYNLHLVVTHPEVGPDEFPAAPASVVRFARSRLWPRPSKVTVLGSQGSSALTRPSAPTPR